MTTLYRIRGRSPIPAPFIHNPTGECKWGDLETLARSSFTTEIVRLPRHWIIYIPSTPHDSTWHNILPAYIKTQPHELLDLWHCIKSQRTQISSFHTFYSPKSTLCQNNEQHESILHIQAKDLQTRTIYMHTNLAQKIKLLNSRNMIHLQINIKATCTGMFWWPFIFIILN